MYENVKVQTKYIKNKETMKLVVHFLSSAYIFLRDGSGIKGACAFPSLIPCIQTEWFLATCSFSSK